MQLEGRVLATIYDLLAGTDSAILEERLADVGAERDDLKLLRQRYQKSGDDPWGALHLRMPTWLVATGNADWDISPAEFEAGIDPVGDLQLVAPMWVLSVPTPRAERGRLPARPLVDLADSTLALAYEGLVEHVALSCHHDTGHGHELARSAVLWRIGAIVDHLEPKTADSHDGLNVQLLRLRGALFRTDIPSEDEKGLWTAWSKNFAVRRHRLSHLGRLDRPSFEECVDYCLSKPEELREAAASISLAVLRTVFLDLQRWMPAHRQWRQLLNETMGWDYV